MSGLDASTGAGRGAAAADGARARRPWRPGCCCATASSWCSRWSSRCWCSSAGSGPAASVDLGPGRRIDVLAPGVLALAVMSTVVHLAGDRHRLRAALRRAQAARRDAAAPRGSARRARWLAVAGRRGAAGRRDRCGGLGLGWQPAGGVGALLAARCSRCCSAPPRSPRWGCCSPARLRAEATLAAANLVYVLLLLGRRRRRAPRRGTPTAVRPFVELLPSGALAQVRTRGDRGGPGCRCCPSSCWWRGPSPVRLLTVRTFRWE